MWALEFATQSVQLIFSISFGGLVIFYFGLTAMIRGWRIKHPDNDLQEPIEIQNEPPVQKEKRQPDESD